MPATDMIRCIQCSGVHIVKSRAVFEFNNIKQSYIEYIENVPHFQLDLCSFLYNLYIFVWIQHKLAISVFALDPSNSVIKRL